MAEYYLQSIKHGGYVGNSILWWGIDGHGYTCNIDKAGVFSEEEARKIYTEGQGGIKAWPKDYIDSVISRHVDGQHTNCKYGKTW